MKKSNSRIYLAIIFGSILATIHLLWLIIVYLNYGKTVLDFLFGIHMLNSPYTIQEFNYNYALTLIVVSFLFGSILGYIYSCLSSIRRSRHNQQKQV